MKCELCGEESGNQIDEDYKIIVSYCPFLRKNICNICCDKMSSSRICFSEPEEPPCMRDAFLEAYEPLIEIIEEDETW